MITRKELDAIPCPECGKTEWRSGHGMEIRALCHPGAPLRAAYLDGAVLLQCALCNTRVAEIAVAADKPTPTEGLN